MNSSSISQNQKSVKKITWLGLFINLLLTVFKLVVGLIGQSQAVVADAFHSLSDMATDFAISKLPVIITGEDQTRWLQHWFDAPGIQEPLSK